MYATLTATKHWAAKNQTAAFILKTVIGANVIAALAQLAVPTPFVAISCQSLGVLLMSFALGRKAAVAALTLYLLEGALGLPVFANGKFGVGVLMGSSGGYLFGFVAMAAILGWASDKGCLKSVWKSLAAAIVATAVMYAMGLAQLSLFVPADKVLTFGLYPFIVGDVVKALVACVLVMPAYRLFQKI
ncbi:biotin transporter BioY [Wielerella bovis]|uniref:biotin transporter BioY n=1 Tax=Wielerella bovis TaxID=2917790 RepID=UPI002019B28F|nr:biotin transporter BioY [Wielerella bovis]ULJ69640.1 biotin transporter BioY [Wielerella bovis]